ncbi:MAG: helix-turn-helix domain-containing protein [Nanoarchaeota archaeon]|nr:helix-turn-helix domain-containing protein [Nanoarchaeota archaeon]
MIEKEIPGLTKNESLVYITLLNLKQSGATKISEKCGLFRTLVYDILTKLIEKGLVSYTIKSKKRLYIASNPKRLLESLKEKENLIKEILPKLNTLFEKPTEECLVEGYEGKEGAKSVIEDAFNDALSGKIKEFLFFGATGKAVESIGYYYMHMVKKAEKMKLPYKIDFRGIWSSKLKTREVLESIGKRKQHRFFPEKFEPTTPAIIYGDKIVLMGGKEKSFTILIKNRELANSFKYYFNFIWEHANLF